MGFIAKVDDDLSTYIYDGDDKVGQVRSLKGLAAFQVAENIADLLNIQTPRHKIHPGAVPHYVLSEYGFGIRVNDSGVIGQESTSITFSILGDYAESLKGRFTPDFFTALCDAMPAPEKPKKERSLSPNP